MYLVGKISAVWAEASSEYTSGGFSACHNAWLAHLCTGSQRLSDVV